MRQVLTEAEFGQALASFEHTAFRLELQPSYNEPDEQETLTRFIKGDPEPPTEVPAFQPWFDLIRRLTAEGKRVERVRVHEDPPTPYQQWERWMGQWNIAAGEVMRYMTTARANEVGLLPAAGATDWWLLDSSRLIQMEFDHNQRRVLNTLVDEPSVVVQACAWRDLAVHYSTQEELHEVAA